MIRQGPQEVGINPGPCKVKVRPWVDYLFGLVIVSITTTEHEVLASISRLGYHFLSIKNDLVVNNRISLLPDTISTPVPNALRIVRDGISYFLFSSFASVLAHTTKLIRAELPHIHEVDGVRTLPFLQDLSKEVAHNLDVVKPLKDYLVEKNELHGELMKIVSDHDVAGDIENAQVNLRTVSTFLNK